MHFSDIYQHEVVKSRRDRSRKALFWARIVGLVLMLTVGATLRSEPELRQALMDAGMSAIAEQPAPDSFGANDKPGSSAPLADRVKVNRFAHVPNVTDPQSRTNEIGQGLSNR